MTYRPYPDVNRARHQIERHHPAPQPSALQVQMAEGARKALTVAAEVVRPLAEGLRGMRVAAPAIGAGSLTIGDPSKARTFEIVPWTREEHERWQRTGFPPGSGWEPQQMEERPAERGEQP
jgi:hypothetical protein